MTQKVRRQTCNAWRGVLVCLTAFHLLGCATAPERCCEQGTPDMPIVPSRMSTDRSDGVAIHAMGLVGTPYRYGGNTPQGGFDCSGLIAYVFQNSAGMAPPRTVNRLQYWGQPVSRQQLRSGDVVLLAQRDEVTHAGIYVGDNRFVHAPSSGGEVRLDDLRSSYWSRWQAQFRRP